MFNNLDRATSEIDGGQRSNRKTASSIIASNVSGNRQSSINWWRTTRAIRVCVFYSRKWFWGFHPGFQEIGDVYAVNAAIIPFICQAAWTSSSPALIVTIPAWATTTKYCCGNGGLILGLTPIRHLYLVSRSSGELLLRVILARRYRRSCRDDNFCHFFSLLQTGCRYWIIEKIFRQPTPLASDDNIYRFT